MITEEDCRNLSVAADLVRAATIAADMAAKNPKDEDARTASQALFRKAAQIARQ